MTTTYRNRVTGKMEREQVFAGEAIRWFYTSGAGSTVFETLVNREWFCRLYGAMQDSRSSARQIPEFVRRFHIDIGEVERPFYAYRSFNDFFTRRLKVGARPFPLEPGRFGSPAEGKVYAFPKLEGDSKIPIKGARMAIDLLLGDTAPAARFRGGAALVVRLAPYDYHRFHFPDAGDVGPARDIDGRYHSVNPMALARVPDLYCRNKRTVTIFDSEHFGRIAYVEVGALCVGTILQTYSTGRVERGQEKGYFKFGGSTVVLLFEAGAIAFDEDLVDDTAAGVEVQVQVGSGIGRKP